MTTIADRVKETSTTTGTGTFDLDGAVTGFQSFVAGAGDAAEVHYCIELDGGSEWEVGVGTVTDAATDTLSRDTVLASSNSGSLVNFSAGDKNVFLVVPADWFNDREDTSVELLHVRHDESSTTHGGTGTSGSWETRTLDTTVVNQITGASLSSNQITLPAGTYHVRGHAVHFQCQQAQARLRNVTDGVTLALGTRQFADESGGGSSNNSNFFCRFTLTATKVIELQSRVSDTQANWAWGYATSDLGEESVYAEVWIERGVSSILPDASVRVLETFDPSSVSELDIELPAGYEEFELRGWIAPATDEVQLLLRADDGSGFDNTNEYDLDWMVSTGGAFDDGDVNGATGIWVSRDSFQVVGSGADEGVHFKIQITRASDAAFTYFQVESTMIDTSGDRSIWISKGTHSVSSALTQLRLLFSSGNIASGHVKLIGIGEPISEVVDDFPRVLQRESPSGASEVDFSLPSGYSEFVLTGRLFPVTGNVDLELLCNDGGGFDSTNEYSSAVRAQHSGGFADTDAGESTSEITIVGGAITMTMISDDASEGGVDFTIRIKRALASEYTRFRWSGSFGMDGVSDRVVDFNGSGMHNVASALTELRLLFSSGNIASGELRLIGIP